MRRLLLLINRLIKGKTETASEQTKEASTDMSDNPANNGATNTTQGLPSVAKIEAMARDLRAMKLAVLAHQQDTDDVKLPLPGMESVEVIAQQVRELRLAFSQHDKADASTKAHKVINALENLNLAMLRDKFGDKAGADDDDESEPKLAAGVKQNGKANKSGTQYTP